MIRHWSEYKKGMQQNTFNYDDAEDYLNRFPEYKDMANEGIANYVAKNADDTEMTTAVGKMKNL